MIQNLESPNQLNIVAKSIDGQFVYLDDYLVLNDAEIHLHPDLQVKFGEKLIRLVKDSEVKLIINSYSPLFIEALEVYSVKYSMREMTNFYLIKEDGNIQKIPYKRLYELYSSLGDAYDIIDSVRGQNLARQR